MTVGGLLQLQVDGQNLEAEVHQVALWFQCLHEEVHHFFLQGLFIGGVGFDEPEGDVADGFEEVLYGGEIVAICFFEHLFDDGVLLFIKLVIEVSKCFGYVEQHFG